MFKIITTPVSKDHLDRCMDYPNLCKIYDIEWRNMVAHQDDSLKDYQGRKDKSLGSPRGAVRFYPISDDQSRVRTVGKAVHDVIGFLMAKNEKSPIAAVVEILDLRDPVIGNQFAVFATYERFEDFNELSPYFWDRYGR